MPAAPPWFRQSGRTAESNKLPLGGEHHRLILAQKTEMPKKPFGPLGIPANEHTRL